MKVIYANILWFILVLAGLINAALNRWITSDWESMPGVRTNYDVLYGAIGIYLVICIIGLISKKSWAYAATVAANATLSVLPLSIFSVTLVMLMPDFTVAEIMNINLSNIIVGLVSLSILVWLIKSGVKEVYVRKSI